MPQFALASATTLIPVTPNASADLPVSIRALYVGTTGDLNIRAQDDSSFNLIRNIPAGAILPISPKRISATNTTASNIVGLG